MNSHGLFSLCEFKVISSLRCSKIMWCCHGLGCLALIIGQFGPKICKIPVTAPLIL